jgi:hypothetical protein
VHARGETTAHQVMQACLDQVTRLEPRLHAFISWNAEDALAKFPDKGGGTRGFRLLKRCESRILCHWWIWMLPPIKGLGPLT